MAYEQWVVPNTDATDDTGACLRFVQKVFQNLNPYYYRSAWIAWEKTVHKSYERNIPGDVAVPVYFSHWGSYNDGRGRYGNHPTDPYYGNWGHVVAWVPGRGYLSSPTGWYGQQWFDSIEAVERAFNARYVGWALDVGGLITAWPVGMPYPGTTPAPPAKPKPKPKPKPPTPLEEIMANPTYIRDKKKPAGTVYALNPVTGKKRATSQAEWSALRVAERAGGDKLIIAEITADEINAIPNA